MIDFFSIHQFIVFFINLIGVWLILLVYQANLKEKQNKIFVLMVTLMLFWVNFAFLARVVGINNPNLALLFLNIAWFATPLFFIFLYLLVIHVLNKEEKYKLLTKTILFAGIVTALITGFSRLIIEGVRFDNGNLMIVYGVGMLPFLAIIFFLICSTLYPLLREYSKLSKKDKQKIGYFLIGIFIFYFNNAIFNITLPVFFQIVHLYWIGDYSTIFLLGFIAYAIAKHKLFEIKAVITSLFVGFIVTLLTIDLLIFTPNLYIQIIKAFNLILFLVFGYYLIQSVLSEIKRAEELEKLTTEVQISHIKLKLAYEKLEKLDKTKSEFISIASHQLRTPLTAIKGYISMILDGSYGELMEEAKRPMENVYQSNERLIKLVNDLLNLSRLEAGKIKFEPSFCSLEKIVIEGVNELKINAEKKNLNIIIKKLSESLPEIIIDENKIRQAFLNILDNAIKYTNEGGEILIELEKIGSEQQIKISDTGEGMSQDEIDELFQSFSRTSAGNKLHLQGAGIGLYVAKKFTEMHKGSVWAESPGKGKGSTFYIKISEK